MPSYATLAKVGRVVVWGDDSHKQVSEAPKTHDFLEVVPGGSQQSLAIREDRSLELWGGKNLPSGNTPVPPLTLPGVRFADAALGLTHMVALREDGVLVPSGQYFGGGACVPPVGPRFIAVAAAGGHDVALDEHGKLHVWGVATVVTTAPPEGIFMNVRARGDYILALRADGYLFGWGGVFNSPLDNQLWDGWYSDGAGHWFHPGPFKNMDAGIVQHDFVPENQTNPIRMPHVLGLYESGAVEGWGANTAGEAEQPSGKFQAVAAGRAYSLGLDEDGFLRQWERMLLPTTTTVGQKERPARHPMPKGRFISISAAGDHAVAVRQGPRLVAGPDFRERTLRQPDLETQAHREADRELSDALRGEHSLNQELTKKR
jgi:alpha-tubulin suppressor-like RCC1 family protein